MVDPLLAQASGFELAPTILAIAHWTIVVTLSLRVMVRRLPVGVSLAWLAVVFSVPFGGAVVYLLFGEKRLGKERMHRIREAPERLGPWIAEVPPELVATLEPRLAAGAPVEQHAFRSLGIPALEGNGLTLLQDTEAIFDAIVAAIDAAERRCLLGFYIWSEGGRAEDVFEALIRAAGRGVQCHVSADALGSKEFLRGQRVKDLRAAGVSVASALPTGLVRSWFVRADLRNHRKIVAIDDRIGFTGSQNLVDPKLFKQDAGVGSWVDAFVRVEGPGVRLLAAVFLVDWRLETGAELPLPAFEEPSADELETSAVLQVVPSGPGPHSAAIQQLLLTTIYAARSELVITTPYFVPDDSVLTAILSAAERGVDVKLVVPERVDSVLVRFASLAHFDDLLAAGVEIARYRSGLLHTKSITVDGELSVFGSVNLDMRSLWLNYEISLFVYDTAFTQRLRALQQSYIEDSDRLELAAWRRRPTLHRLTEDALRLASPLL